MKKAIKRSIVVLAIAAISLSVGLIYGAILDSLDRATHPRDYSEWVEKYSAEYGVAEHIVYSVIKVESGFDSAVVSHAGAIGLMQMTPETFEWVQFLLGEKLERGMLYDPETNIKYGTYLLSYLFSEFGNWESALAAYNAGMARVKGWLDDPQYTNESGRLINIPIKETREYVAKVDRAEQVYLRLYYGDN